MDAFLPPPRCALNPAAPPLICSRSGEAGTHRNGSQGTTAFNKSVIPASATAAFLLRGSTSVPGWVTFLPQASLFSGSIRVSFNLSRLQPETASSPHTRGAGYLPGPNPRPPGTTQVLRDGSCPRLADMRRLPRRPGGTGPPGVSSKLFLPFVMSPSSIQGDGDPGCLIPPVT